MNVIILNSFSPSQLEKMINEKITGREVVNIKYSTSSIMNGVNEHQNYSVLIMFED